MSSRDAFSGIDHLSQEGRDRLENSFEAAAVCEWCADECERHDDDHCRTCAEVLRECAENCRTMASA